VRQGLLGIGPLGEFRDNPSKLPHRRIVQRVGKRLRSRRLYVQVAGAVGPELVEAIGANFVLGR
jgi:hypothetical protein